MEYSLSHSHHFWSYLALSLLFLISERVSVAGDWSIDPSIYIAGSNNDNIFLSPSGGEKNDNIFQLNPSIKINRKGRRGSANLYYEMQNILYAKNGQFNDTFNILNANAELSLSPNLFFIDTTLGRDQQIVSRNTVYPLDNMTISTNRTNVDVISVSPFIKTNIGNKLMTEIRYTSAWTRYDQGVLADIRNQTVSADLRNDLTGARGQWAIVYSNRKYEVGSGRNTSYQRAYANVDFSVSGKIGILASVGYENNEYNYNQGTTSRFEKSSTWDAGFRWSPSRTNSISVRVGERAFGKTSSLDFNYKTQRWTWNAGYNEEFRNNLGILVRNQKSDNFDTNIVLPGDATPTTETYLSRRFDLRARRRYGKTNLDVSIYDRRREFQQSGQRERIAGEKVKLDWQFQKRSKFLLEFNNEKQNLRGAGNDYNVIIGAFALVRTISRKADVKLDFRFYKRDSSNSVQSNYKQNQVTLGLTTVF